MQLAFHHLYFTILRLWHGSLWVSSRLGIRYVTAFADGPVADDDAKCLNIDAGCGELRRLII